MRSTFFLNHRTNWESVYIAVKSFTGSTILKSFDTLDVFDRSIGEVIGRLFPPLFCVVDFGTSNGWMPTSGEIMMLRRLLSCLV